MAEALVSIVLERLASVTEQWIRNEISLVVGVGSEIQTLTEKLQTIRAVLADAEQRQVKEQQVRLWLERLTDMAYQMDDVVDEWSTAILKSQIKGVKNASMPMRKKKVCCCFPFSCISSKQVASRRDIALKIQSIKQQLDVIENERILFKFSSSDRREEPHRLMTTSAIDISEVYGRDSDRDAIVNHLLGEKPGLPIISIVGTGGMGKTTLAQLAYNSQEVKAHFDERIWVCVSDPFDPIRIFRAVVEALQKATCNLHDLEALQQQVQTCISGKKFLLVLDDVWTENHQLWEQLNNTLKCEAVAGSRILATTRKDSVVKIMGSRYKHSLGELPQEQSRALFHQIAFFEKSGEEVKELKEMGERIADKCKGLPLAIKTLGSLMRRKDSKGDWEKILNSEVWQIDEFERHVSPALLLSYYDLPPAIKRCFSYCAVFPKDHEIKIEELIELWMAQGYLNSKHGEEMESVGGDYLKHLAAASLLQDFEKDDLGNIMWCKMHDVVHDFAQFLTQNECFIKEVESEAQSSDEVMGSEIGEERKMELSFQKGRHASLIVRGRYGQHFVLTDVTTSLHTLLVDFKSRVNNLKFNFPCHLTCLRALDLEWSRLIKEIPREIGKLIHLRYLNLSHCIGLICLPETICDLYNLQTLNIRGCSSLSKLPQAMGKLINLRHLRNFYTARLEGLPQGIGRLESLQTLDIFIACSNGKDGDFKIEDLRNLNELRGSLEIDLRGLVDGEEAEKAGLKNKERLHHLTLSLRRTLSKSVIDALQPHQNLESLDIRNSFHSAECPSWMTNSYLIQLKRLQLYNCSYSGSMPPLGEFPLLEILELQLFNDLKYMGDEFLGSSKEVAFPKLRELSFGDMSYWEKWQVKEDEEDEEKMRVMPSLRRLTISRCPKWEAVPDCLLRKTTIKTLRIGGCPLLEERYNQGGKDWPKISHIPEIRHF